MNAIGSIHTLLYRFPLLVILLALSGLLYAQTEEEGAEGSEKADAILEMRYTEANNTTKFLSTTVKSKVEGSYVPVAGVKVNFYRKATAPENLIGSAVSGKKGTAVLTLPDKEAEFFSPPLDYTYVAAIEGNDQYNDVEEEIAVAESDFDLLLEEEDSVKTATVTLLGADEEGNMVGVPDAEVRILVKRLFGLLPVTEDVETTDEDGQVRIEFPADIPGDSLGNIIIVAKIDDHERYGFLEFRKKINWGVPVLISDHQQTRELWSSRANAPLYLIFVVNAVLIGIWGVILYLIFDIYKIRKIGRASGLMSNS